ncbi:MAG: VOC family protein [Candidatus Aenigmarchaeota archaeon]|nr:VOC family protein [Candidatus Aenigmarchaeota archaeon]
MDKVVHFEIPVDNPARAKKFYEKTFGWKVDEVPGMPYWMATTVDVDKQTRMPKEPGAINGGFFKRQGGERPVVIIDVKSVDAYLKKVQAAGGRVTLPKQTVGDMGFYARFVDTEGNEVGLWETIKK